MADRSPFAYGNRAALLKTLAPLRTDRCPFVNLPTGSPRPSDGRRVRGEGRRHWGEGVTPEEMPAYIWLRPETVAEIKFAEWTTGAVLRYAEFVALRDDKTPTEVHREVP